MLKVAIVGFGEMGKIHAQALQGIPDASLVAIADVNPRRAEDTKPYNCAFYTSAEMMLQKAELDIAIVAAQASQHRDLAIAALQRDLHVICEKPMALSLDEADEMVEGAAANNRLLAVNHGWVFMEAAKEAKRLVQEGAIGELQFMEAFGKGRLPPYDLMEIATHNTHLMHWLAGPVEWMAGHVQHNGRDAVKSDARPVSEVYPGGRECGIGVGDYLHGYYKFQNGVCGSLYLTQLESIADDFMSVELRGTRGRMKIYQAGGGRLFFNEGPLDSCVTESPWEAMPLRTEIGWAPGGLPGLIPATRALVEDFVAATCEGRKPEVSGEDGRAALEMALGIYAAHLAGKRLAIPLGNRNHPLA